MLCLKKYINDIKHYIYWCKQLKHYRTRCAYLLATPTHTNIGDSAIIVAEADFLKQCGYETIIEVTAREYEAECKYIKHALPKKADIFLPGGGNMGSLWPIEEEWRMQIINDLLQYDRHILIFPQTIYYSDSPKAQDLKRRTIELYNRQTNLILTAREKVSYDLMKSLYPNLQVLFSPDIVLSMKQIVFRNQRHGILVCFRNDKEKVLASSDKLMLIDDLKKKSFVVTEIDTMADEQITKENRWSIVRKKLEEIASARLIVTDRLHGMVFAAITGTPCLVMGNNHHKVYGTYEWLKSLDYIKFVSSIHQIEELVDEYYNKTDCVFTIDPAMFSELREALKI